MTSTNGLVITRTPFRISFFGGGTDFPGYFHRHPGAVLGTTINKYTYVTVNSLERILEKRIRLSYSKLESANDPAELDHGIVREVLLENKSFVGGGFLDIHSFADLPNGSGVGSSSSFAVGFLNAVNLLHKKFKTPRELASEAIHIERVRLKEAGGWQDQIHAAFGGFNKIVFDSNGFEVIPLYIPLENLEMLESSLMFFFTGLVRSSAQVQNPVMAASPERGRSPEDTEREAYLKKLYDCVGRGEKILTSYQGETAFLGAFGELLHENWELKKSFSPNASYSELDRIYDMALESGAIGGKLIGAGGGGFVVFVVPKKNQEKVRQRLNHLNLVDIRFEKFGSRVIFSN